MEIVARNEIGTVLLRLWEYGMKFWNLSGVIVVYGKNTAILFKQEL